MGGVVRFPPSSTATVGQTIDGTLAAIREQGVTDSLVVGYDANGELFVRSSRMDRKSALWLIKAAEHAILYEDGE